MGLRSSLRRSLRVLKGLVLSAAIGGAVVLAADAPKTPQKPKYEISEIMNKGHKGNGSLLKKVTTGKATAEETKKLVEYYRSLVLHAPPKGEQKSWQEKTTALLRAGEAVAAKKSGSIAALEKAANCRACHTAHKPD